MDLVAPRRHRDQTGDLRVRHRAAGTSVILIQLGVYRQGIPGPHDNEKMCHPEGAKRPKDLLSLPGAPPLTQRARSFASLRMTESLRLLGHNILQGGEPRAQPLV